jgi:outer membrane protein assembly factor BamD (BamD/ComL family)
MKKIILLTTFVLLVFSFSISAQDKTKDDPFARLVEADAVHNLDVAWQYFKLRKAYKGVLLRTEETIAAHPEFTKMDEVLYLAGMSSYYLSIGKGRQKIDLSKLPEEDREKYQPSRLKEDAEAYLSQLVENYKESKYVSKAKKTLKKLTVAEK